jgi:hypothetical protein
VGRRAEVELLALEGAEDQRPHGPSESLVLDGPGDRDEDVAPHPPALEVREQAPQVAVHRQVTSLRFALLDDARDRLGEPGAGRLEREDAGDAVDVRGIVGTPPGGRAPGLREAEARLPRPDHLRRQTRPPREVADAELAHAGTLVRQSSV